MESSKNQIDLTNAEVRVRKGSNFGSAVDALLSKMVIVGVPAIGVLLLFAALAGTVPPEVNEAHYWCKAKHFWDPSFCSSDFFLNSQDAHLVFYWFFGWLTLYTDLETAVWAGRLVTWSALAISWSVLAGQFVPFKFWKRSLCIVFSSGLLVFLTRNFDLAGEWVVGGVEAKGMAMAFSLLALSDFLRGNRTSVWIWGGLASAFHVLVGGWLVLALWLVLAAEWVSRRFNRPSNASSDLVGGSVWQPILCLCVGGCISFLGLLPGLALNFGHDPDVIHQANHVYTSIRLPHHLLINSLPGLSVIAFSFLVFFLFLLHGRWAEHGKDFLIKKRESVLVRKVDRLFLLSLAVLVIAFTGGILGALLWFNLVSDAALESLLRFYWFRCSDFIIPVVVVLLLIVWSQHSVGKRNHLFIWGIIICMTLFEYRQISVNAEGVSPSDRLLVRLEPSKKRRKDTIVNWKKMCRWVKGHTDDSANFLTPLHQNTFKWYAHRAEVVAWKDVPQDPIGLLDWRQRTNDVGSVTRGYFGYYFCSPDRLRHILRKYSVDYIVMYQYSWELGNQSGDPYPLKLVYPDDPKKRSTFVVLKVDLAKDLF